MANWSFWLITVVLFKPCLGQSSHNQAGAADGPLWFSSWLVRNIVGVIMAKEKGAKCVVAGCSLWALTVSSHDEWISFTSIWCWAAIIGLFTRHRGTWGPTILTPGGRWTSAPRPLDSDPQSISLCSAGYPQLTSYHHWSLIVAAHFCLHVALNKNLNTNVIHAANVCFHTILYPIWALKI